MLGHPAELPIGAGCTVYNNLIVGLALTTSGAGPGNGTAVFPLFIPNDPALRLAGVESQFAVFDLASAAIVPVSLTPGGKIVIY